MLEYINMIKQPDIHRHALSKQGQETGAVQRSQRILET